MKSKFKLLSFILILVTSVIVLGTLSLIVTKSKTEVPMEGGIYRVTDYSIIEIDLAEEKSLMFKTDDMLGIDREASSGYVFWDSSKKTLEISDWKCYQTTDPLVFDDNGSHKALITFTNSEDIAADEHVQILLKGYENEVVCYGSAIDLKGNCTTYDIIPANDKNEGSLHIQNKKTYEGVSEAAIKMNADRLNIGGGSKDTTIILSGVGGLEAYISYYSQNLLYLVGRANLFINLREERVYYNELVDNAIFFPEEEVVNPAIKGFDRINFDPDDALVYRKIDDYYYDFDQKNTHKRSDGTVSNEYYYGRFTHVSKASDLEYLLLLKEENQEYRGNFDNIILDKDIDVKEKFTDYRDFYECRGLKRLFLNGTHIYYHINTSDMPSGNSIFHVTGVLDIYGMKGSDNNYIRYEVEENSALAASFIRVATVDRGKFQVNNGVTLWSSDDYYGADDDVIGCAVMVYNSGKFTLFDGIIKGSTINSSPVGFNCNNDSSSQNLFFKMFAGLIYCSKGTESYGTQRLITSVNYRIFGGTFVNACSEYIFNFNDYDVLPGHDQCLKIVGGYNPKMRVTTGGAPLYYNGIYPISYVIENNICCADAMWFADPLYYPHVKQDFPDEVNVDGTKTVKQSIELVQNGENDYAIGKGYYSQLFIELDGETLPLALNANFQPYDQLSFTEEDGKFVLRISPTLAKEFDGMKVFALIKNNYTNAGIITNKMTINIVDPVEAAEVTLSGPKEAFDKNNPKGAILEMGRPLKENQLTARITSTYTDTVYAVWWSSTDGVYFNIMESDYAKIVMTKKDSQGRYYTEFKFSPSVSEVGTKYYRLDVYTFAKYDDDVCKFSESEVAKFTVEAGTPIITGISPTNISAIVGDTINATVTTDGTVPNVNYRWYYYPSYEHMTSIDSAAVNVEFDGVSFNVGTYDSSKQYYKNISNNKYHYSIRYHLIDVMDEGINRIIFDMAQSLGKGSVNVKLVAGNKEHNLSEVTLIDKTFDAIMGSYEFNEEFNAARLKLYNDYYDPDYYDLVIDFSDTPLNAEYIIENFYLEHLDLNTNNWMRSADLNPYFYAKLEDGTKANYQGVFELGPTGDELSYEVKNSDDGIYIYCKAYNGYDVTKAAYSDPIKLSVGAYPQQPVFNYTSDIFNNVLKEVGDKVTLEANVETPFVKGDMVVGYQWDYFVTHITVDKNDVYHYDYDYYTKDQMFDNFGIKISTSYSPSTGMAINNIELVNKDLAQGLENYTFFAECTAYSTQDNTLTDVVSFNVVVVYDFEDAEIIDVSLAYYGDYEKVTFSDSSSKYKSKDGQADIHDIVYMTDGTSLSMQANPLSRYDNYSDGVEVPYYEFVWMCDWLDYDSGNEIYAGRKVMELDDLFATSDLSKYVHCFKEYDKLILDYSNFTSDEIPYMYRNLVVFCRITNTLTGTSYDTERYQISYIDLSNLPKLQFKNENIDGNITVDNFVVDPATGDLNFNITVSSMAYKMDVYPEYDIFFADILAIQTLNPDSSVKYDVKATPNVNGIVSLLGPGYIENWFAKEDDQYIAAYYNYKNNSDKTAASFTNANSHIFNVTIKYDYFKQYLDGELEVLDKALLDRYLMACTYQTLDFTSDELKALAGLWFDYYKATVEIEYCLNGNTPVKYFESNTKYMPFSSFEEYYLAEIDESLYTNTNIVCKQGFNKNIDGTYTSLDVIDYKWYKVTEDGLEFIDTNNDPYVDVDTSKTGEFSYVLELSARKLDDETKCIPTVKYITFDVSVIANLAKPTINEIKDYDFYYLVPNAALHVDAGTNVDGATLEYCFMIDGEGSWTTEPYAIVNTDTLGDYDWYVRIRIAKEVEDYDGTTSTYYSDELVSDVYHYHVLERVIDTIYINNVPKPIAGEKPKSDGLVATSSYENDEYVGYKIVSSYWDVDANTTFAYDTKYKFTVIVDLLENCNFDNTPLGYFNIIYECDVIKLSATQAKLVYEFTSTDSVELSTIELKPLPVVEIDGLILPFEVYEKDEFKVTEGKWNITKGNYTYNTEYVLELVVEALNGYHFAQDIKVKVDGKEVEYTFDGDKLKLTFNYLFSYHATIKIGDNETEALSDKDGKVHLSVDNIPAGKMFDGWYIGDEKISSDKVFDYVITQDGLTIEAKFKDIPYEEHDGNYEHEVKDDSADISELIALAKDNNLGVKVIVNGVSIIFSKELISSIENLQNLVLTINEGSENVSGDLDKAELSNIKAVYEISLGGINFTGTAEIIIPLSFDINPNDVIKVYYVSPTGAKENMQGTLNNKDLSFKTNHFSTYVITSEINNVTYTVNFDANGGSGTMAKVEGVSGSYNLPSCSFTAPDGKTFSHWDIDGTSKNAGDSITVTKDITLKAIWKDIDNNNANPNNKGKSPIGLIIIIILVVLTAGAILLYFFVFKKKKEENGVVFGEKKTLNEQYLELSKEDRKLYDEIKAHAIELENVKTSEAQDYYTVLLDKAKIVRFRIRKGEIHAEFFANDKEFKEIAGDNAKETPSNIVKVKTEDDAKKVIDAIDYKYNSLTKPEEKPSDEVQEEQES